MSCSKSGCSGSDGTSEINTNWCEDTSVGCTNCTPSAPCDSGSGSSSIINNFTAVLKVSNSWAMPGCGATAILSIPCLTNVMAGSYLWNSSYGYLKVISYNSVTNKITVQNDCLLQNAPAGTPIPAGTVFIVADRPYDLPISCTALTLPLNLQVGTSVYTLSLGTSSYFSAFQTLQIAGRTDYFFRINAVLNSTQVQVTVFPPVTSNTVIAATASVCTYSPCDNYEYRPQVLQTTLAPLGSKVIQQSDQIFTSTAQDLSIFNASQCRTMEVAWTAMGTYYARIADANTYAFDIHYELLYAENSNAYTAIADRYLTWYSPGDGDQYADMTLGSTGKLALQIAPQGSATLHFKLRATYSGAVGSTSTYSISGSTIKVGATAINFDNS